MRDAEAAISWGRSQITHRQSPYGTWSRYCLAFVRLAYGVDYVGSWPASSRNAGTAWDRAKFRHRTSDPMSIPRGVPVFFETPGEADHIVLSLGGGRCLSNDFKRAGQIDEVAIADIAKSWGPLVGWSEDLIGNRVWTKPEADTDPKPAVPPAKRRHRTYFVDLHPVYQRGFDFTKARAEGIRAVAIKLTEGEGVSYGDDFSRMYQNARAAGMYVSVYHWLHAGDDAYMTRQAQNVVRHLPNKSVPVDLDVERGGTSPNAGHVRQMVTALNAQGVKLGKLYMPRWYWSSIGSPALASVPLPLWNSAYGVNAPLARVAAYAANVSPGRWSIMGGKPVTFLQFGSRVRVAGMGVDCNVYRGPVRNLARWFLPPVGADTPEPETPEPPKRSVRFQHGHTSGRFDRSPELLEAFLDQLMATCDLVTGTEVADEARGAKVRERGWGSFRGPDNPGQDECFIAWDKDVWRLRRADIVKVTDRTYFTTEGKPTAPTHVTLAVLENVETKWVQLVTVGHYPSAVEGNEDPDGPGPLKSRIWSSATLRRVQAHIDAVVGTRTAVAAAVAEDTPNGVIICGDWNLNILRGRVWAWFGVMFPTFVPTVRQGYIGPGTLGKRVIDVTFASPSLQVVEGPSVLFTTASDHRGYTEVLESV